MKGIEFKHLKVPDKWQHYWTKYPEGFTILEALIDWVSQVNKMTDYMGDWTKYLDEFVEKFDEELQETVLSYLEVWKNDGTLAEIINHHVFNIINENINTERINALKPPIPLVGLTADGIEDDSDTLQNIINYAHEHERRVFVPGVKVYIRKTVTFPEGSYLEGAYSTSWANDSGTEFISGITTGEPVFKVNSRSVQLKNFTIRGTIACDGISVVEGSFDFMFENVKVKGCRINFNIVDAWTYQMRKCRAEGGNIGFNFEQGTSANVDGCVAFNSSEYGFKVSGLTYTSFAGCGSDGATVGLDLSGGIRGITFVSFGVENAGEACIRSTGSNFGATFTGLNIGNHSGKEVNIIEVDGSLLTFTDFRLASAMSPKAPGKILSITDNSNVTLINPDLYGEVGDLHKCTVIGGNYSRSLENHNRLQKPLEVDTLYTKEIEFLDEESSLELDSLTVGEINSKLSGNVTQLETDGGISDTLFTVEPSSVYLCTAVSRFGGEQFCGQIIMVNGGGNLVHIIDMFEGNAVEFINDGYEIKLKNNSQGNTGYNWTAIKLM